MIKNNPPQKLCACHQKNQSINQKGTGSISVSEECRSAGGSLVFGCCLLLLSLLLSLRLLLLLLLFVVVVVAAVVVVRCCGCSVVWSLFPGTLGSLVSLLFLLFIYFREIGLVVLFVVVAVVVVRCCCCCVAVVPVSGRVKRVFDAEKILSPIHRIYDQ